MTLQAFVEANPKLVTARASDRYPDLRVVKYTRKVFYDALWTPELEECRGLVVDEHWQPVIKPFRKIYNRNEMGADFPLDQRVTAVKKINGFMAAATWVNGHGVIISTTGSLDSDFVKLAERHLLGNVASWINTLGHGYTWLFEICDPTDPHIIVEEPGPYLIGARSLEFDTMMPEDQLDRVAQSMQVLRPVHYPGVKFSTVLQLVKDCQHEGYVVHGPERSLKIKSPFYLVNKFLARARADRLEDMLLNASWKDTIDEEFFPLMEHLTKDTDFLLLEEQTRLIYLRNWFAQ